MANMKSDRGTETAAGTDGRAAVSAGSVRSEDEVTHAKSTRDIGSLADFPDENPNPVLRIAVDGTVLYANVASGGLLKSWGCKRGEAVPVDQSELLCEILASGSTVCGEAECDERVFALRYVPIIDKGYVNVYGFDITQQKESELALEESEERFSKAFRSSPIPIIITTLEEGCIVDVNPSFVEMIEYDRDELLGNTTLELGLWKDPQQRPHLVEAAKSDSATEHHLEALVATKSGQIRTCEIAVNVMELGGRECALAFVKDITERKRAEERYRTLVETARDFVYALDTEGMITFASPAVEDILGYTPDEVVGRSFLDVIPQELHGQAIADRQSCLRTGAIDHEIALKSKSGQRITVEDAASTIVQDGRVVGIMGSLRDATERKQTEEALRASEEKYRSLVTNIPDVTWTSDIQGNVIYVSPNIESVYGYTQEDIYEESDRLWSERIHPDDVESVIEAYRSLFETEDPFIVEYRIQRKDGQWIWARDRSIKTYEKDGVMYADGVFSDVTEQRLAEEAMLESENRYRTLADATFEAVFVSENGLCVDANQAAARMFGYELQKLIGIFGTDVIAPESRELVKRNMLSGYEGLYESVGLRKDGSTFPCEIRGRMAWRGDRHIRITAVRDVTERKQAEKSLRDARDELELRVQERTAELTSANEELRRQIGERQQAEETLRKNEARLQNAQRVAQLGFWEWDILANDLYWSEEIYNIFGMSKELFGADNEAFMETVHPEDLDFVKRHVDAALREDVPYNIDHRIVLPDGQTRYVHEQAEVTRQADGTPIRMVGTVQDITERQVALEALRESRARYFDLTDCLPQPVFETDMQGNILIANQSAFQLFGHSREDLTSGMNVADMLVSNQRKQVAEDIRGVLHSHKARPFEYLAQAKDGSTFPVVVHASAMLKDGEPVGVRGVIFDIRERKRAEEDLQRSEEQVRLLLDSMAEGAYGLDLEGKCTFCNPSSLRMLGYESSDQLQGKRMHELVHHTRPDGTRYPADECRVHEGFQHDEGTHANDEVFWRFDGTSFPVEYSSHPIRRNGRLVGSVVTFLDITQR